MYSHEDGTGAEDICQWHSSPAPEALANGDTLSAWLESASVKFEERFESTFRLSDKVPE